MNNNNGIGVGIASVLVIVVILALTTFGILSLTMAYLDMKTSVKAADFTTDYYTAESKIQNQLAELNERILKNENLEGEIVLTEKVDDKHELRLKIRTNKYGYEIISNSLVVTGEWKADNSISVWEG